MINGRMLLGVANKKKIVSDNALLDISITSFCLDDVYYIMIDNWAFEVEFKAKYRNGNYYDYVFFAGKKFKWDYVDVDKRFFPVVYEPMFVFDFKYNPNSNMIKFALGSYAYLDNRPIMGRYNTFLHDKLLTYFTGCRLNKKSGKLKIAGTKVQGTPFENLARQFVFCGD